MFGTEGKKQKAVAYYRHSAEDKQENSVPLQREQIQVFADKYNVEIVHEESDEGKSGLSASRPGFERLFDEWVLNEEAEPFDYVLVLDVTRWGRFQDPDEAAYWEMQCKKRNIRVVYITRGFPKEEEKLLSSLEVSIGRYMAAEYSRQLSDKVWHGSMKVSEQGFSAGGTAPYGYVRVLLDENHNRIGVLKPGEHKVIANQRVTFEPASDDTPSVIQRIFDQFTNHWLKPDDIAEALNNENIPSSTQKTWDSSKVLRILSNETYTGTRIYNKTWHRLKQKSRKNPSGEWVRSRDAFEPIINRDLFQKTQERLYWLMFTRWKHGIYTVNQAERSLHQYVDGILTDYESDHRFEIIRNLPVIFSLTYYEESTAKRCFVITENMRKHSEVLAISVSMFVKHKIDAVFLLPIHTFGPGSYLVIDDVSAAQFKLEECNLKAKVLDMCETIHSNQLNLS
jgi:DNA invertase Pin-like site-specific DNA recombinase